MPQVCTFLLRSNAAANVGCSIAGHGYLAAEYAGSQVCSAFLFM